MDTANKVCWYGFITYMMFVIMGAVYVGVTDIFGGNAGGFSPSIGRADMYVDFPIE